MLLVTLFAVIAGLVILGLAVELSRRASSGHHMEDGMRGFTEISRSFGSPHSGQRAA